MKNRETAKLNQLLNFLNSSPTAWHAISNCASELKQEGFQELKEEDAWKLKPGELYFTIRNGSSICAFILPKKTPHRLHLAASHSDSPAFKLKPNAEFQKENMLMLGVEVYGAPLLSSWLNRDLGIAGRIVYLDAKQQLCEDLVCIDNVPVVIPQLAIHLDRTVNESGLILNKQEHLSALAGIEEKQLEKQSVKKRSLKEGYLERLLKKALPLKELLAADLFLYPLEEARLIGEDSNLLSSYRIDSLVSVHAILKGFLERLAPSTDVIKMIVFWDNEEIGSQTLQGAGSPFLAQILERIALSFQLSREEYFRLISLSLCTSVDLAHAVHPNYSDKHDPCHKVFLNGGVAIKASSQCRYASDARSTAAVIALCKQHKICFQKYVSRGDIPAGTTVGPIHASLMGMPTVDIGCPQLSMHSSREIISIHDYLLLTQLLKVFF